MLIRMIMLANNEANMVRAEQISIYCEIDLEILD
jgi:hypothetical protein